MSIRQKFDVAKAITNLSPTKAIELLCLAYGKNKVVAFRKLVEATYFSKMSKSQMTRLNLILYRTACENEMVFAKQLLKIPNIDLNFRGEDGYTVLMRALNNGFTRYVDILLADPRTDVNIVCTIRSAEVSVVDALSIARSTSLQTKIREHASFNHDAHSLLSGLRQAHAQQSQQELQREQKKLEIESRRQNTLRPLLRALHLPRVVPQVH